MFAAFARFCLLRLRVGVVVVVVVCVGCMLFQKSARRGYD